MHGARISLAIGVMSVLMALIPGVVLGLVAAFNERVLSPPIMRTMDVLLALPGILLAICVITILGPGWLNTMIAIAVGSLPGTTRLARAAARGSNPLGDASASRHGVVVQLVRIPACHAGGRGFEPRPLRQYLYVSC